MRPKLASHLQNPRFMEISFHTLRHWKATMLYHQTKDVLYVKQFLGHKSLDSTLLYIQLEKALLKEDGDKYTSRVAANEKEICGLVEAGFEYVCAFENKRVFRKRK